ncbi:MAG: imidazole glycerol phosphate synthase subunit HisF [Candidatus Bathyarchaeota archaeon]|nr:imidazole glycerol phosphate synthase subunit HisF [Candidatus Bathyarchaeota archaeon]MDH5532218.1 imidazole glycerol phosphate synthase subunit HisF [Candidatus Bathyarchaeota archaeon]MDH5712757.1 imidazole glycerol phosphate synthase subunit HisF [Candidatus Bathyarchaeota archaeon]
MLTKRIIPCLDVKDGKVVKGVRFKNLKIEGDPAKLAAIYEQQGADELVFLDITASYEKRGTILDVAKRTADTVSIPFTVGGGIRNLTDIQNLLNSGVDKASINTAAVKDPTLIKRAVEAFGSQCIVIAIDAKRVYVKTSVPDKVVVDTPQGRCWWEVYIEGGNKPTGLDAISWAMRVKELGAGELLPTSMDYDGTQDGYDISLTRTIRERTNLPVIASGGAGSLEHIFEVLTEGKADAALAASIFHRSQYSVGEVKRYLTERGVRVRLV